MKTIEPNRNWMKEPASWVIKDRESGKVLFETFEKPRTGAFTNRYEVIGIGDYLASLNAV